MIKANVILDYPKWTKKIKKPNIYFKQKLIKLSKISLFKNKSQEFSVLLTNSKKMKELNNIFRKKNKPTDVLSFPVENVYRKKNYLGDIAISFEFVNKKSNLTNFNYQFDKIWVHGYLHLIGYDHKKIKEFKIMNKKENLILNYLSKKIVPKF